MANSTTCLNMNTELWSFREDYTTLPVTVFAFSLLYFLIIVTGVIGNVCVLLAISRTRSLQTVPNMFIFSLSCSDLVVCCISATITPITAFKKEWLFGPLLCSVAPFMAGISLCFSTFTLTAISIDRYRLIRYPMKKAMTKTQALCVIAGICLLSAAFSSPTMLKQKLSSFENFCGLYCTEDWQGDLSGRRIYGAVLLVVQFVIPLTIITISYTAISVRLGQSMLIKGTKRKSCPPDSDWHASLTDQQRMAMKRRQRTNRMLIGMVVAFSASWSWSVAYNVCRDYDMLPEAILHQEYLFGIATHAMAMTSTVWNPLLYAMLNLQFRAAFQRLMPARLNLLLRVDEECDERAASPLINGAPPPLPSRNGGGKLLLTAARGADADAPSYGGISTKYGATQQSDDNCFITSLTESCQRSSSNTSFSRQRKPSAIRVLVSRLSASVADASDAAEAAAVDEAEQKEPLLGDDSPTTSEEGEKGERRVATRNASRTLSVVATARRRSTACIVRVLRSPSPAPPPPPSDSYVTISRTNSF